MANCGTLSGIELGCRAPSGIKKVLIGVYPASSAYTGTDWFTENSGTVSYLTGTTLYEYETNADQSTAMFDPMANVNGTFYTHQTVNLVFTRLDATARNEIMLLGQHPKLTIVVLDANDTYWLYGQEKGMRLIESTGYFGTAPGDPRGYTLIFESNEKEQPYVVETAAVTAILG